MHMNRQERPPFVTQGKDFKSSMFVLKVVCVIFGDFHKKQKDQVVTF